MADIKSVAYYIVNGLQTLAHRTFAHQHLAHKALKIIFSVQG